MGTVTRTLRERGRNYYRLQGIQDLGRRFLPRSSADTTPEVLDFAGLARFGATGSQVPAGVCSAATLNLKSTG